MIVLHVSQARVERMGAIAHVRPGMRAFVQPFELMRTARFGSAYCVDPHRQQATTLLNVPGLSKPRHQFTRQTHQIKQTVVAYVRPSLAANLRGNLPNAVRVVLATSWADISSAIRQNQVDSVFVDPGIHDSVEVDPIFHLLNDFPSTPLVVYTMMTPATFGAVHQLTKHGLHEVVLYGYDDTKERMAALLEDLPQRELVPLVVKALRPRIAALPVTLQRRVHDVLNSPKLYASVEAIVRGTSFSRSSMYNEFREAGLASPGHFIIGARLIHALAYLSEPGHSLRQAALKLGWQDSRIMTRYLKRVCGVDTGKTSRETGPEKLVERLVCWLTVPTT